MQTGLVGQSQSHHIARVRCVGEVPWGRGAEHGEISRQRTREGANFGHFFLLFVSLLGDCFGHMADGDTDTTGRYTTQHSEAMCVSELS